MQGIKLASYWLARRSKQPRRRQKAAIGYQTGKLAGKQPASDVGNALKAARSHSRLSNAYAKQWKKHRRAIAAQMIALSTNNVSPVSTMPWLASRLKSVLHTLSKLPDDFGLCVDEEEILLRLKNITSGLRKEDRNVVAQRSLAIRLMRVIGRRNQGPASSLLPWR